MMRFLSVLIFTAAIFGTSFAQDQNGIADDLARRQFYLDYAAFRDTTSPGMITLEVYYKIFSSGLSYQKWNDKFRAKYTVDITVNHKKKQITGASKDGELVADNYKQTKAEDDFVINRLIFRVPAGDYELNARLSDATSGETMKARQLTIKLNGFGKSDIGLSTIEFVREAKPVDNDSQFVRFDEAIIPSVSRIFGEEAPDLVLYYEIYNTPGFNGNYQAIYEILKGNKKFKTDTAEFAATGKMTYRVEHFNVSQLLPDEYTLYLNVQSPGNKLNLKSKSDFLIGWSAVAIVKSDWKAAIDQLRYVASSDEIKKLGGTPPEERLDKWESFWKAKDPTPSTSENELKDEYYRRIRYADLNFGNFGRNGWKTDMGRVYVTYGPPDEIERHPFDIDSKPYQIWYYYNTKRVFTFVDVNGYGDFELLYPYDGNTRGIR